MCKTCSKLLILRTTGGAKVLGALQQILLFDGLAIRCLSLQGRWHRVGLQNVFQSWRYDERRSQELQTAVEKDAAINFSTSR